MRDVVAIVEKAGTLRERLTAEYRPDITEAHEEDVDSRLRRWCETAAEGDWGEFERRLLGEQLDCCAVRGALGPVRRQPGWAMPDWSVTLSACLDRVRSFESTTGNPTDRCIVPDHPLAFEDLLLCF